MSEDVINSLVVNNILLVNSFVSPVDGVNTSFCVSKRECYVLVSDGLMIYYVRVYDNTVGDLVELMDGWEVAVYYLNGIVHYARISSDEKTVYYGRLRVENGSLVKEHEEVVDSVENGYIDNVNIAVSENGDRLVTYQYTVTSWGSPSARELRANGVFLYNLRTWRVYWRKTYPAFIGNAGYVVFLSRSDNFDVYDTFKYVLVYKVIGSQVEEIYESEEQVDKDGLGVIGFNNSLYITYVSRKNDYTRAVRLIVIDPDGSYSEHEIFTFQMDNPTSHYYWWATPFVHAGTRTLYVLVYRALVNTPEATLYLLKVDTENKTASLELTIQIPLEEYQRGYSFSFSTMPVVLSRLQLFTYTITEQRDWYLKLGGFLLPVEEPVEEVEEETTEAKPTNLLPLLLMLLLLIMFLRAGLKRFKEG